jgi:formylglycine-generating enzyme required for sulfatase activity
VRTTRSLAAFAIACATLGNAPWQPTPPPLKAKKEASAAIGAVTLAAPIEGMVLVKGATLDVGSDAKEQRWAIDLCRLDPLGAACKLDQFSAEGRIDEINDTPLGGELRISPGTVVATVGAFWIDRTEVTVGAYRRCVQVGDCRAPGYDAGDPKHDRDDLPVTMISWDDAKSYCAFVGKRLPGEDEWELAARGTNERRYPWGMLANPKLCNHGVLDIGAEIVPDDGRYLHPGLILLGVADDVDGFAGLAPVGSFPEGATPDGIVDLSGNAAEWVEDVWSEAHVAESDSATDKLSIGAKPSSAYHVARGGSFRQPMAMVRAASRVLRLAPSRDTDLGFRCAKDGA